MATSNSTLPSIVSVSLNNGSGGFSSAPDVAVGSNPIGLAVVDVDSDGDLDLLTADNGGSTVSVRLNNGTGSFSNAPDVPVSLYPQSLAAADVDGDGDVDLLTGAGSIVSVRLNQSVPLASRLPASHQVEVYPVPAYEQVLVRVPGASPTGYLAAELSSTLGQVVRRVAPAPGSCLTLEVGSYVLRLQDGAATYTKQVVVK